MKFSEKIKQPSFWVNVLKIAIPFLIIITIISLFVYSYKDIFAGNWDAVANTNFNNGEWKRFFASKAVASFLYGLYVTNKNTK
jgi:hypothetical protein